MPNTPYLDRLFWEGSEGQASVAQCTPSRRGALTGKNARTDAVADAVATQSNAVAVPAGKSRADIARESYLALAAIEERMAREASEA